MQKQFIEWALKYAEDSLAYWRGACFLEGFRQMFIVPPPVPSGGVQFQCPVVQVEIRNGWVEHTCNGVIIERYKWEFVR